MKAPEVNWAKLRREWAAVVEADAYVITERCLAGRKEPLMNVMIASI